MSRMKDLTGLRFGMLVVESRAEDIKPGRPSWNCRCDCGNSVRISSTGLQKPMERNPVAVCDTSPPLVALIFPVRHLVC